MKVGIYPGSFDPVTFGHLGTILIYVALVLTVVSLIDYIAKNKDVLKDQK